MIDVVMASGTTRSMNPASVSTQWWSAAVLFAVVWSGKVSARAASYPVAGNQARGSYFFLSPVCSFSRFSSTMSTLSADWPSRCRAK